MTLFLTASSFDSIFTQVPKTFNSAAGRSLEASWRRCHSSSGSSLSQFVSSCHSRQTEWWWDQISVWSTGCCQTQKSHWIVTINGKMNVWNISYWHTTAKDRNYWLKPFFSWWKYKWSNNFGHRCMYIQIIQTIFWTPDIIFDFFKWVQDTIFCYPHLYKLTKVNCAIPKHSSYNGLPVKLINGAKIDWFDTLTWPCFVTYLSVKVIWHQDKFVLTPWQFLSYFIIIF